MVVDLILYWQNGIIYVNEFMRLNFVADIDKSAFNRNFWQSKVIY